MADGWRRVPDDRLPAQTAGRLRRSGNRDRTRAGKRLARLSRPAGLGGRSRSACDHRRLVLARARDLHAHRPDHGNPGRADEVLSGVRQRGPVAVDLLQVEHVGIAVGPRVLPAHVHALLPPAPAASRLRWRAGWRGDLERAREGSARGLAGFERRLLLHRRRSAPRARVLPAAVCRDCGDLLRRCRLAGLRRRVAAFAARRHVPAVSSSRPAC